MVEDELADIAAYIEQRFGERAASRLYVGFDQLLTLLSRFPTMYPIAEGFTAIRRAVLLRKSIVYDRVDENVVSIVGLLDGRQEERHPSGE